MNAMRNLSAGLLLSSLALTALPAGAVSYSSNWFANRHNTAGTTFTNMSPSATHFCFLTTVGVTGTAGTDPRTMCRVTRVGDVDRDLTKLAIEQAAKSLSKVPATYLEDMECGERFCRAIFGNEKGEPPVIQSLFGEPPFVNDGFIINEADGRVAVYFTRPGESLEDLRREAQKAAELAGR